jgi:magnesium chelatase accessory protein
LSGRLSFERDGKDWPNREASRFIKAAGLMWHVQVMGRGPVILLVHGTGASSHSFADLAQILAQAFTVVVPDLPGHGFTEMPPSSRMSLPGMAEDLAALLGALKLAPDLAVGHSAGAAILIEMCLDKRIAPRSIVGINAALLPFKSFAGQFFSPLAKLLVLNPVMPGILSWTAGTGGAVERLIGNTGSKISPSGIALYERLFKSRAHVAAAMSMMANWDLFALERRLDRLDTPLILVVGTGDKAISPDDAFKLRERLPHAEIVTLRGLGHLAHEERPEDIAEIVAKAGRPILAAAG